VSVTVIKDLAKAVMEQEQQKRARRKDEPKESENSERQTAAFLTVSAQDARDLRQMDNGRDQTKTHHKRVSIGLDAGCRRARLGTVAISVSKRRIGAPVPLHHTGGGSGLPVFADNRFVEVLRGWVTRHKELSLPDSVAARGTDEGKVWAQRFAHFGHLRFQTRRQGLSFDDLFSRVSAWRHRPIGRCDNGLRFDPLRALRTLAIHSPRRSSADERQPLAS
jgi:hypothetical protein